MVSISEDTRKKLILELTKDWLIQFELGMSFLEAKMMLREHEEYEEYEECAALLQAMEIRKQKIQHERINNEIKKRKNNKEFE